jgi:DNA adenine methylase
MIKSPLRYPGGKSRAVKIISPIIPEFDEFREPFLGGGSVFVYLKQKYPNKTYWINDLYPNLFHFWKQTQNNVDKLIEQIYNWRSKFENGKELHKYLLENIETFDELKKASAFFVFNRITFSINIDSKDELHDLADRINKMTKILNDTNITNYDYQDVIEKEGKNVFIFLDPPYFSATKSALYGKNGNMHKTFDHIRFANVLKNTNHKWLITYDDSEYIRDLFSFANINEWNLTYGMRNVNKNGNQNGKELFISNYKSFEKETKIERTLFDEMKEILPRTKAIHNADFSEKQKVYAKK